MSEAATVAKPRMNRVAVVTAPNHEATKISVQFEAQKARSRPYLIRVWRKTVYWHQVAERLDFLMAKMAFFGFLFQRHEEIVLSILQKLLQKSNTVTVRITCATA